MAERDSNLEVSPNNSTAKAEPGDGVSVRGKKGKMKQRNNRGSGCVYRPKYKTETGEPRLGGWRIKFTHTDPNGVKKTANELVAHATSKQAATDYLNMRRAEIRNEKSNPAVVVSGLRYEDLRALVLADYEVNNRKSLTTNADGEQSIGNLKRLDAAFGGRATADITTGDIAELKLKLRREGLANGTVNRTLALLRRMFVVAVSEEKLRADEIPKFVELPEATPREGFLELEDFLRLRQLLPERLRTLVTLAFYTGMRWGEIRNLRWESVDLLHGKIRLGAGTTKNKEARTIPLMGELAPMLAREKKRLPGARHVFAASATRPIASMRKAWVNACLRAELGHREWVCRGRSCERFNKPTDEKKRCAVCGQSGKLKYVGLTFHDFRRTGVRNLVRAGVPESVAMAISGHKTRSVFEHYNITSERDLDEAAAKVDAYMAGLSKRLVKGGAEAESVSNERESLIQ